MTPLSPEEFAETQNVSRETIGKFTIYLNLLRLWNAKMNLVGASTLADPWRRHILDCAQLYPLLPARVRTLVDLGSGAGLPGLILAIQGVADVHLIESDTRKAAFLGEAARAVGARVTIHACRIEAAPAISADAVTARALKPLTELIPWARRFVVPGGACYFHKGESWRNELAEAAGLCHSPPTIHPSLSDPASVVIEMTDFAT